MVADPNFYKAGSLVKIQVEERIAKSEIDKLLQLGHQIEPVSGYELGSMQGILVDLEKGTMAAGADPRRVAYAVGW